jgi:beta-lactamase class D
VVRARSILGCDRPAGAEKPSNPREGTLSDEADIHPPPPGGTGVFGATLARGHRPVVACEGTDSLAPGTAHTMTPRTTSLTAALGIVLAALAPPVTAQTDTDIYLLDLAQEGRRLAILSAPFTVTARAGYDNQPAFTTDGRAILYTSIRDGQADTYRYDLATGRSTRVTATPESEYSPTPIPGTQRFSVVRVEADETQRLWSFAPDGSDPRLLLPDVAPVGYHAWATPDRLALFVLGEPAALQLAELETGTARVVASDIGRAIQPVPGRAAVTFTQRIGGEWWLRELDSETTVIRSLARLLGPDEYHVHTPHGAILAAHGSRIYQLRERRGWQQVADLARYGLGDLTRLAVSPDGRLLAVVADRPATSTGAASPCAGAVALAGEAFAGHDAAFVWLDPAAGVAACHGPTADRRVPASTFKIPHTLIALDIGILDGPDARLEWDRGKYPREDWWPAEWARDHTLRSALEHSVVWYYREVAELVGPEREREYLEALGLGNAAVGDRPTSFWLGGPLEISVEEQVVFLERLWAGALPVSSEAQRQTRDMVSVLGESNGERVRGKTGTVRTVERALNWLVGVVERPAGPAFYAFWIEADGWMPLQRRLEVLQVARRGL